MNVMTENIARVQISARLGQAQQQRRDRQLIRAHRLTRRAELAAQQARDAFARAL